MPELVRYAVGFPILADRTGVALIWKKRPTWQKGRLNGIGGKLEPGETPAQAMDREAAEEAGLGGLPWQVVARLTGVRGDFEVSFFAAFDDRAHEARSLTDEAVEFFPTSMLWDLPLVPNLRVILPLALDRSGIRKPLDLIDEFPAT